MRLLGFRFQGEAGPVSEGFVSLGQVTAVIGTNDAGKSRLLDTLTVALTSPFDVRARFYAQLEPQEIPRLFGAAAIEGRDRDESEDPFASALAAIETPDSSRFSFTRSSFPDWQRCAQEDPSGWMQLSSALTRSSLFAFQAAGPDNSWDVAWCLPAPSSLDEHLQVLLGSLRAAPPRPPQDAGPTLQGALVMLKALPPIRRFGDPMRKFRSPMTWERSELSGGEPYPFVPIGKVPVSWLPAPITIPTTDQEIAAKAIAVISGLLVRLAWHDEAHDALSALVDGALPRDEVFEEILGVYPQLDEMSQAAPDATRGFWLERPTADVVHLSPHVATARTFVERYAQAVAPAAIRQAYELRVQISADSVLGDQPLVFRLAHRDADEQHPGAASVSTDDVADGYRAWVQLAFLEAISALQDLGELDVLAPRVLQEMGDVAMSWDEGEEAELEVACRALVAAGRPYLDAVASIRAFNGADCWTSPRRSDQAGHSEVRAPLYLLDEPERHLHPRVVSQLAGWLRDLVRVRDSQGLVVTHAVPFINQADALAYVRRDGIGASVRSCSHDELGALSEIAAELGLDRGQLLADTEVILFVEGRSDQYVLEGLFGDRLRQIGVAVVPLHGATQLAQVVDSQLLLRFSTARLAALIDDLDESEIQRLQNDREYLEAATRSRKTEEQALAKLLKEAFAQGRSLTALGLPAKDIFFLLDADAIRETFRELRRTDSVVRTDAQAPDFADYPGHDQFWAEFGKSAQENEKWKAFCERRYGIPYADVSWYARVADHMHARKKFPSALVDVVDRLARLAL